MLLLPLVLKYYDHDYCYCQQYPSCTATTSVTNVAAAPTDDTNVIQLTPLTDTVLQSLPVLLLPSLSFLLMSQLYCSRFLNIFRRWLNFLTKAIRHVDRWATVSNSHTTLSVITCREAVRRAGNLFLKTTTNGSTQSRRASRAEIMLQSDGLETSESTTGQLTRVLSHLWDFLQVKSVHVRLI